MFNVSILCRFCHKTAHMSVLQKDWRLLQHNFWSCKFQFQVHGTFSLAHLSLESHWWAYSIGMLCRLSVGIRPSVHHFQRSSSPKLLGQSKPNFMWSLHGSGEQKFVQGIWVTWTRWPPRPYMVKTLQKSSPEPKGQWPWALVCSIGALGPSKSVQMMTLGWPWPIL